MPFLLIEIIICAILIIGDGMKKYFLFIFVFVLLMISGICSGSALTNSIEAPYYENYRYIEPTESFANGTNKPVIFTIGGTYYFCSHLHLTEPLMYFFLLIQFLHLKNLYILANLLQQHQNMFLHQVLSPLL